MEESIHIEVKNLTMTYGDFLVLNEVSFNVKKGEIFFIVGGSGSGKTTLMKHMIGLLKPEKGDVLYDGISFIKADDTTRDAILIKFGVLFQSGALWSSMTLIENVLLPLEQHSKFSDKEAVEIARLKLSLVGLRGFEEFYPAQLSGGMRKRAGLARAMALDPQVLFFDEPSSGLDPVTSKRLDDLIKVIRDSLGTTVVIVSHELQSIMDIADRVIYLDPEEKRVTAEGTPEFLKTKSANSKVVEFFNRGKAVNKV